MHCDSASDERTCLWYTCHAGLVGNDVSSFRMTYFYTIDFFVRSTYVGRTIYLLYRCVLHCSKLNSGKFEIFTLPCSTKMSGLMVSTEHRHLRRLWHAGTPLRRFRVQIQVFVDCVFSWCKSQALNIRDWWCSSWFGLHAKQ